MRALLRRLQLLLLCLYLYSLQLMQLNLKTDQSLAVVVARVAVDSVMCVKSIIVTVFARTACNSV